MEKVVPLVTFLEAVRVPYHIWLPAVDASQMHTPSTVPQSAVAVGKVSVPELEDVPAEAAEKVTA